MNTPETVTHEEAIELLPWLVNGSLEQTESAAILAHARFCVTCRTELDGLADVQRTIVDDSTARPVPAPDMRRINRRIDELTTRRTPVQRLVARLHGLFANPWRTAFVTQTVVLTVAVAVWVGREPPMMEFTTLTRSQELPAGDYIRVAFSPALEDARIEQLLDELELSVSNGPSQRGVYTLAMMSESDREIILAALRSNTDVLFAEPVYIRARE